MKFKILFVLILNNFIYGKENFFGEKIVITGSRLNPELRVVSIITNEMIKSLPIIDTVSLLSYISSIDLRERALFGGQADLNILGATFEEVLVLVDSFPIQDSQTGHHHLEFLPPLEAIERIEILRGPASSVYGSGAFGGVYKYYYKKSNMFILCNIS